MTLLKLAAGLSPVRWEYCQTLPTPGSTWSVSALTFFSVRVCDKPADEDHTYGHGKIENLSAFAEAGLMAISCAWIIWEAMQRIVQPHRCTASLHLAGAGAAHFNRRRLVALPAIARRGRAHRFARLWRPMRSTSPPTSGPPSPCSAGLGASWLGASSALHWLRYADPVRRPGGFAHDSAHDLAPGPRDLAVLMDEVPAETRRRSSREVERCRACWPWSRPACAVPAPAYFADLTLALPRRYTFEHTGELVRAATDAVHRALPEADVVIHTVPREARAESIFDRVRAVAARNNVSVHELSVQSHHGKPARRAACGAGRNHAAAGRRTTLSPHGSRDSARDS